MLKYKDEFLQNQEILWIYFFYLLALKLAIFLQYFAKRFDFRPTIITGDFLLILSQVIYVGIATFAPATAMQICK